MDERMKEVYKMVLMEMGHLHATGKDFTTEDVCRIMCKKLTDPFELIMAGTMILHLKMVVSGKIDLTEKKKGWW